MYQKVITGCFLLLCASTDIKCHGVSRRVAAAAVVFAVAGHLAAKDTTAGEILLSMLPGACCFLLSFLTREELGYGDSLAILVCGISEGWEEILGLMVTGFFFAALWAAGLCIFCRAGRKKEIPLMPFMAAAFLVRFCCGSAN